jgi:mono/diheme cytochrome c family protein
MIRASLLALVLLGTPALAQSTKSPSTKTGTKAAPPKTKTAPAPTKTTLAGVYTRDEATAGKEMYASLCSSCHTSANRHDAPEFRKKWTGKTLSELFTYMRASMPKNDPSSLADEDYGVILAYMLQLNKMPPGKVYLSTDTLELRKIRIDTVRTEK